MTADGAYDWLSLHLGVSRETFVRLHRYVELLIKENAKQNLIAANTIPVIWQRHVVDSAQLLLLTSKLEPASLWVDIGSGAGLPGMVTAILSDWPTHLIEPRTRRADFLCRICEDLGLSNVTVVDRRAEQAERVKAAIISARAVAPLEKILKMGSQFSTSETTWLLPKGKGAKDELNRLPPELREMFHVEQSLTEPSSGIIVGRGTGRAA